jgi:outer membrane protein assembly factor BamB
LFSSPTVADGRVCVGSYDDKVYALNASTGAHIQTQKEEFREHTCAQVTKGRVEAGYYFLGRLFTDKKKAHP